jgi:hypothetical protein
MAEDYVSDLQKVRDAHVRERRRIVRQAIELAEANKSPIGANWGQDVMHHQAIIEAIDRAIDDEKKNTPSKTSVTELRV